MGIELYAVEQEAIDARDHYNHNLARRAVITLVQGLIAFEDYYGGTIFIDNVDPQCWMLVVED
jgi:hypothetical protein